MSTPIQPQNQTPIKTSTAQPAQQPTVIAVRKRCDANGVGLSHFILMDRKPAK